MATVHMCLDTKPRPKAMQVCLAALEELERQLEAREGTTFADFVERAERGEYEFAEDKHLGSMAVDAEEEDEVLRLNGLMRARKMGGDAPWRDDRAARRAATPRPRPARGPPSLHVRRARPPAPPQSACRGP